MKWTQRQIEAHDDAHPYGCENPYCGCREQGNDESDLADEPRCDFCGDTATARYGEFQVCAHHYEDSCSQVLA